MEKAEKKTSSTSLPYVPKETLGKPLRSKFSKQQLPTASAVNVLPVKVHQKCTVESERVSRVSVVVSSPIGSAGENGVRKHKSKVVVVKQSEVWGKEGIEVDEGKESLVVQLKRPKWEVVEEEMEVYEGDEGYEEEDGVDVGEEEQLEQDKEDEEDEEEDEEEGEEEDEEEEVEEEEQQNKDEVKKMWLEKEKKLRDLLDSKKVKTLPQVVFQCVVMVCTFVLSLFRSSS